MPSRLSGRESWATIWSSQPSKTGAKQGIQFHILRSSNWKVEASKYNWYSFWKKFYETYFTPSSIPLLWLGSFLWPQFCWNLWYSVRYTAVACILDVYIEVSPTFMTNQVVNLHPKCNKFEWIDRSRDLAVPDQGLLIYTYSFCSHQAHFLATDKMNDTSEAKYAFRLTKLAHLQQSKSVLLNTRLWNNNSRPWLHRNFRNSKTYLGAVWRFEIESASSIVRLTLRGSILTWPQLRGQLKHKCEGRMLTNSRNINMS